MAKQNRRRYPPYPGSGMDYAVIHTARMALRKPNRVICIYCHCQAKTGPELIGKHEPDCPARNDGKEAITDGTKQQTGERIPVNPELEKGPTAIPTVPVPVRDLVTLASLYVNHPPSPHSSDAEVATCEFLTELGFLTREPEGWIAGPRLIAETEVAP